MIHTIHSLEIVIAWNVSLLRISYRNIGDIAVKDIIPAKVEFVMTLLNNSDSIRHDLDHMMYHMGNMITLKQSVIDSVSAYIEQNRNFIQNLIGREFQFDTFFRYYTLLHTAHLPKSDKTCCMHVRCLFDG